MNMAQQNISKNKQEQEAPEAEHRKYKEITSCRICGAKNLTSILHLGKQRLSGVFPKTKEQAVTCGPLELVKCASSENSCGLVQLRQSYALDEMYGLNYGYRSGLNSSMVAHLRKKVENILKIVSLGSNDLVIDIGSNDSTLLQAYPPNAASLAGIDPTGIKFKKFYPPHVRLIEDFFSADLVRKNFGERKAKIITSIAMFYDLESPMNFMEQIRDVLDDDGIWVFEQSYLPTMLEMTAYDTICHEHLEYYGLKQIQWMADKVGLEIIDVELNDINGGSFSVTIAKAGSKYAKNTAVIEKILKDEINRGMETLRPYEEFARRALNHKERLLALIRQNASQGKKIFGYGASTKGNIILQFCGLTERDIPFIAEVNEDKFGAYTPGTHIPIISEKEAHKKKPDYFMVLPWHFRKAILERERPYLEAGGKLIFPLPSLEVFPCES